MRSLSKPLCLLPLLAVAGLALAGCVGTGTVSRDTAFDLPPAVENIAGQNWRIAAFEVDVPRTLSVSEANTLKPRADIVWRGDPLGDRHTQVDALMTAALEPAFATVAGDRPVFVSILVTRFHAQTERVRYSSVPSEHEIEFVLTISDAETGRILSGPRDVDLTFRAHGGNDAIAAEASGVTQAVHITGQLQAWVAREFSGRAPQAPAPDLLAAAR